MSSYPVLDNKPIDQWKVTELKEELKRRKLTTKGLKDDLIKRLAESIQKEIEANTNAVNGFDCASQTVVQCDAITVPNIDERTTFVMDKSVLRNEDLNNDTVEPNVNADLGSFVKEDALEQDSIVGTDLAGLESDRVMKEPTEESTVHETTMHSIALMAVETRNQASAVETSTQATAVETSTQATAVETSTQATDVETSTQATDVETSYQATAEEFNPVINKSLATETALSEQGLQNSVSRNQSEDFTIQLQNKESNPPHEDAKLNSFDLDHQVFEVSKVTSDYIITDNASINEKKKLKDNIAADDVKLEFDVKPDMDEPPSSNIILDDGNLQSTDVKVSQENKLIVEETGNNADIPDGTIKNDNGEVALSEKLNLDRSSGDDSMEEDAIDSKQIESKSLSDKVGVEREKTEVPVVREDFSVDVMVDDLNTDKKVEDNNCLAVTSRKRKPHGQETVGNSEVTKRQCRWNADERKVLEPQSDNVSPSITSRDTIQSTAKCNISRSDSTATVETPKERVVPPSPKPPTSALRIDRFLRPFTLKAVQELLGKTGTVTNFWMDHIKTHCYVSYSSVEEAVETRNAVYDLQWPPNGGRNLVAEFVEPQEVKILMEAPPSSTAPVSTVPALPPAPVPTRPQPSPRLQVQKLVPLPPPPPPLPMSLPPPQPLSNPPAAREQILLPPLPLLEKIEPPIVTLDDLFRKTRATPRIYYLPLSDEQVAAKLKAEGKTTKQ